MEKQIMGTLSTSTANDISRNTVHSEAAGELRRKVNEISSGIGELAVSTVKEAKQLGERAYSDLSGATREQSEKLEGQIKNNPLTSLAIAFGVGFLLRTLLRR